MSEEKRNSDERLEEDPFPPNPEGEGARQDEDSENEEDKKENGDQQPTSSTPPEKEAAPLPRPRSARAWDAPNEKNGNGTSQGTTTTTNGKGGEVKQQPSISIRSQDFPDQPGGTTNTKNENGTSGETVAEEEGKVDETAELYKSTLPIEFLSHEMGNDVRDGYLVRELYVYIPFLILFLTFSLNQLPIERSHFAVQALKDSIVLKQFDSVQDQNATLWNFLQSNEHIMMAIDKRHEDIANDGDWQNWWKHTSSVLWHCGNNSQSYPTIPNPPYSNINEKDSMPIPFKGQLYGIGNVRVRTLRVRPNSCSMSADVIVKSDEYPDRYAITDQQCWADHTDAAEEKGEFCGNTTFNFTGINHQVSFYEYKDCSGIPGTWTTTEQGNYRCGGYVVEIPFRASCADALAVVDQFQNEDCPYVDAISTRFVMVEFFTYSPSLDAFFSVKAFNEVMPGGAWIPDIQFRAFTVYTNALLLQTVLDFIFLAFVLYYLINFFSNLRNFYQEERSVLRFFLQIWNLVDFVNLFLFIASFSLRWSWWSESTKVRTQFPFPDEYPDLEQTLWVFSQMRYTMAFNFILTFLKVMKYLKISQKLNILAVTFEKSQTDVLGLLVIFLLILTGYAVAGTSLFGTQMWWFSSVDRSFSGLLLMLLGEMDYESMKAVNPLLAGLYFWSFLVLSFFLLLNFIVAVVSEAFNAAGEQEWSLALADAFLLTMQSFWRSIKPSAIHREITLTCKGHSSLNLRSQALSYVKQNEVFLKLKYPTSLEIPVSAAEVLKWVPAAIREDYRPLFEEDWRVLLIMYKFHQDSDDEQVEKQRKESVIDGTRAIVRGPKIDRDFKEINKSLTKLEQSAKDAISAIRKKLGKDEEQIHFRPSTVGKGKKRRASQGLVGQGALPKPPLGPPGSRDSQGFSNL